MAVRRRRVRAVRNPHGADQLPTGEWIPAHAVRFNDDGSTSVMAETPTANRARRNRGSRRRNIAAGFYDEEGIFHPIRASFDYSASRAGERARAKPKKKKRAKKRRR